jgi:hypothetical protein
MDGFGICLYLDGREFKGEFKNNKMDGYGEYYWRDGRRYFGFYKDDKKDGFGIYIWSEKKIYIGEWKGGEQSGYGKCINSNKSKIGNWENGKLKSWLSTKDFNRPDLVSIFNKYNNYQDIMKFIGKES